MSKSQFDFKPYQLKLEIKDDGFGHEYIDLDVFTAQYIQLTKSNSFALVTQSYESLPFEAYVIPVESSDLQAIPRLIELQTRAEERLPLHTLPTFSSYVYAIHIEVKGSLDGNDYSAGSSVALTSGILNTNSIRSWISWRYLSMPWIKILWGKCGLDAKAYEPNLRNRIKYQKEDHFSKISSFKPLRARDEKQVLLLTICMLYNYWQRCCVSGAQRAFHLERLRFSYANISGNLSSWYGEADCEPMSRSVALQYVKHMSREARRFYESHRDEIEHLLPHTASLRSKVWLHSSFDEQQHNKYIESLIEEDKIRGLRES